MRAISAAAFSSESTETFIISFAVFIKQPLLRRCMPSQEALFRSALFSQPSRQHFSATFYLILEAGQLLLFSFSSLRFSLTEIALRPLFLYGQPLGR